MTIDTAKLTDALAAYLSWDPDIQQAVVDYHQGRLTRLSAGPPQPPAPGPASVPVDPAPKRMPHPGRGAAPVRNNSHWSDDDVLALLDHLERAGGWDKDLAQGWAQQLGRTRQAVYLKARQLSQDPSNRGAAWTLTLKTRGDSDQD